MSLCTLFQRPMHSYVTMAMACALAGFVIAGSAMAAGKGAEPIQIEADRMVSQEEKNSVVFIGKVDARQGDLRIRSDEMTVYYEPKKASGKEKEKDKADSSEIKKLICVGNVEVNQGDWIGTGKRMDYLAGERKAILSGDAKAWKGQSMVQGQTIVYYLDEGRSIVEQDKDKKDGGRVKAVIQQGKK